MKHTFRKCLSLVLALATLLSVCVVPLAAVSPKCNHYDHIDTWTYIGMQEPTCTEYGGHVYKCGNCETRFVDHRTWKEPLNHKNPDGSSALTEIDRVEPTLEQDGHVECRCNLCGETVVQPLSATKCKDGCSYEYVTTATCEQAGEKIGTCSVCGHVTKEAVAALGHAWDNGKVEVRPECGKKNGKILFTCTRDNCTATQVKEEIAPDNHEWLWKEGADVACSATPGYVCVNCDAKHPTEPYSETKHNFVDYDDAEDTEHVNVAPTCTDGLKWQKCENCGAFKSVELKANVYGYHVHPDDAAANNAVSYLTKISNHTCGNPGFMKCSKCGREDIPDVKDPAAHSYVDVLPTCTDYGYKSCTVCGHTVGYLQYDANNNEIINKEFDKLGHLKPTDANAIVKHEATCTEGGYIEYVCQRCNEKVTETTDSALGHNWQEVAEVPAECGKPGVSKHTVCANCGETQSKTELPALEHEYVATRIPANCMYPAHNGQVCKHCGEENMDPNVMTSWTGEKDENAHRWDNSKEQLETKPTCSTPGLIRKYCTICKKEHQVQVEPTGHDMIKIGVVPVTCQSNGYDVYYCTVCGGFEKRNIVENVPADLLDRYDSHAKYTGNPEEDMDYVDGVFTLTPTSHTWETSEHVKFVGNLFDENVTPLLLCGTYSYEERTCSECGVNYNKRLADENGLLTGEHHPVSADVPATCTQSGYQGRTVCARCNTVITAGVIIPAKHTFDKEAADYVGKTLPTCEAVGFDEKGTCTVCGESGVMNGEVAALGHKQNDKFALILVPEQKATCTLPGYDEHYKCALCGKAVVNSSIEKNEDDEITAFDVVADIAINKDNGYVAPLGHDFTGTVSRVPYACMKDGYSWTVCTHEGCSEIQMKSYTLGYANHRYSDKTYSENRTACQDSYCLCQNMVQDANGNLVKCEYKWVIATGEDHKNAAGEVIDISDCKNWVDDQDHTCASCNKIFTIADVDHHGEDVKERISATCISYEYDLHSCTRCKRVWTHVISNVYGDHAWVAAADSKAPTWTTFGQTKLVCSLCGEDKSDSTVTKKAAEVYFSMDVANKFGGTVLTNGGFMAVTIKMQTPSTDLYSVKMSVTFDPAVLEFAGKNEVNNIFGISDVTTAYCDNNGMNTVEIYAHAENASSGKIQNVTVKGTETLVTLYFKIKPTYYDVNAASLKSSINFGDITVLTYDATAFGKTGYKEGDEFIAMSYDSKADVTDNDDIKVDTRIYGSGLPQTNKGAHVLVISKLGDLNGDGVVGIVDAGMLHELVINASAAYDAQADLNKDGKVDAADFILLKQYMVNKLTYSELAKR